MLIVAIYAFVNLMSVRYVVEGASMSPTFESGQFLMVSRLHYVVGMPDRGDIVIFHFPGDTRTDYIKRIIGLPGETIEIRNTQVFINGVFLEEPYLPEACLPEHCFDAFWQLAADEYFMMGDNRNRSSDSRMLGPVQRRYILGEAVRRYWPPSEIGLIHPGAR